MQVKKYNYLLIAFIFLFNCCSKKSPEPQPSLQKNESERQVEIPVFSGSSSFQYLIKQTQFGPRNPGSYGHQACLNYLFSEMQQFADTVYLQKFTENGYKGEILKLTNIISSFNRSESKRVLLIAHWDTRPRADGEKDSKKQNLPILGANDGASGVAVLLEVARHLKSNPPKGGVDIVFVDGEDYGKEGDTKMYLLGSKYFAKHLPEVNTPVFGILLDMVGDRQLELQKEQYSLKYAPDIVELVWSAAAELGMSQFLNETQGWVIDDHLPLNEIGIKTIDLIDFDYPDTSNRFWHTTEDTPDKCSAESLEAVGKIVMQVIYRYAY
jgi:glutaminyl-peptide cyclotransferase